jgi:DNA-binding NtrC family response regulator
VRPYMVATIVIVDNEPDILYLLKLILTEKTDYKVLTTTDPHQTMEWCKSHSADVLISALRMPEMEGIELLKIIKQIDPNLPLIFNTAFGTIEPAVEAIRHQAFDFITKPFKKEQILMTIDKALKWRQEQLSS